MEHGTKDWILFLSIQTSSLTAKGKAKFEEGPQDTRERVRYMLTRQLSQKHSGTNRHTSVLTNTEKESTRLCKTIKRK